MLDHDAIRKAYPSIFTIDDSFGDDVCKPTYTLAGAVKLVVPNTWSNSLYSAKSDNADIIVSRFIKVFS